MKQKQRRRESAEEKEARQKSFVRGSFYLVSAVAVLFLLAYYIPDVLKIDLAGWMRSARVVAVLRIIFGLLLLSVLAASVIRAIRFFALEGEDWKRGLRNAAATHLFSRDALSIVLLLVGGVALFVWGVISLF